MADATGGKVDRFYAWGRLSAFGLTVAVISGIVDQAAKFWLLYGLHIDSVGPVAVTPFLDLVLTWNTGISYGLFPQQGDPIGPWARLAFKIAVVVFWWACLSGARSRLMALALGLIIGGSVSNAIDRLHWPGGMNYLLLHAEIAGRIYRSYVFSLADVAIVVGFCSVIYALLRTSRPQPNGDASQPPTEVVGRKIISPTRIHYAGFALTLLLLIGYAVASSDLRNLVTGKLLRSLGSTHERVVAVARTDKDSFYVTAQVNGSSPTSFSINTSASAVVLTEDAAKAAGLPMNILNYSMSIETGNGPIRAAPVTLDSLTIGAITERSVSALVAQPPLNVNMLGMSFLNRLESYEGRGDRFIMRGRP